MDKIKQHTPVQSILLHMFPGLIVLGSILFFSHLTFSRLLGIDEGLSPIVGYLLGLLIGLLPIQFGILLIAGKHETGNYSIKEVIRYTEKSRLKEYSF